MVDEAHRRRRVVATRIARGDPSRLSAGRRRFEHTGWRPRRVPRDVGRCCAEHGARRGGPIWTPTIEGVQLRVRPENHETSKIPLARGAARAIVQDIRRRSASERLGLYRRTPSRRPTMERKFNQYGRRGHDADRDGRGIPMKFHAQATCTAGHLGQQDRRRPDVHRSARHVLAGRRDEVERGVGTVGKGRSRHIAVPGTLRYIDYVETGYRQSAWRENR